MRGAISLTKKSTATIALHWLIRSHNCSFFCLVAAAYSCSGFIVAIVIVAIVGHCCCGRPCGTIMSSANDRLLVIGLCSISKWAHSLQGTIISRADYYAGETYVVTLFIRPCARVCYIHYFTARTIAAAAAAAVATGQCLRRGQLQNHLLWVIASVEATAAFRIAAADGITALYWRRFLPLRGVIYFRATATVAVFRASCLSVRWPFDAEATATDRNRKLSRLQRPRRSKPMFHRSYCCKKAAVTINDRHRGEGWLRHEVAGRAV